MHLSSYTGLAWASASPQYKYISSAPYDIKPNGTDTHTIVSSATGCTECITKYSLAWLGSTNSLGLGRSLAWLGWFPVSARLYYTAPYRFLVSMFRAPVLLYTGDTGVGLGWAWVNLSPVDKFDNLNLLIGLGWIIY